MQKLYCYVDESGQDTKGEIFIVTVVVAGKQRDELLELCERIEKRTGKGKVKWHASKHEHRMHYLQKVFYSGVSQNTLRYAVFHKTKEYELSTARAIARAIHWEKYYSHSFEKLIYIDGLSKNKRKWYSKQLSYLKIPRKKVRGIRKDENNALIRLADAVAGVLRDALANKYPQATTLVQLGKRKGALVEV